MSGTNEIVRCNQYNYLGVILDECLTMKQNFNIVFQKFSYKIYQFGKIRKFLDCETRVLVYKQTVLPLTEYVSFVLCLNNKNDVDKLQILQNRALRLCFNVQNPRDVSVAQLHLRAKVDMLNKRRMTQLLCIFYDNITTFKPVRNMVHNTRLAEKHNIDICRANTQLYTKSPFNVGGHIWNQLPRATQELTSKNRLKKALTDVIIILSVWLKIRIKFSISNVLRVFVMLCRTTLFLIFDRILCYLYCLNIFL